ncbi:hypothetical protein IMSAGC005_04083 [Lachnospiraceae bacterium]|nr:hypothetical protein IMSAGC005_04083 [Lachnospiraceae bacterium]
MYYDPSGYNGIGDCPSSNQANHDEQKAANESDSIVDSSQGDKKVPNPNGKRGGQAHQDTTAAIQPSRDGGELNYEVKYDTPEGNKSCRYADAVEISDGEISSIHQVGKVNQNGLPVARESRAIEDIMSSPDYNGAPIYFWPYNSDMGPIIYQY